MAGMRLLVSSVLALALAATSVSAQVQASYLYKLSSFSGPLRDDWGRIHVDDRTGEIYVVAENRVRIYAPSGMEVFSFGDDLSVGQVLDAAVAENGDIIILSSKESRSVLTRCDFRGLPLGPIEIRNLPPGAAFGPNRIVHRNGLFYLVSLSAGVVTVVDSTWEFRQRIDFLPLLDVDEKLKDGLEMFGFAVDRDGNIYFSVPVAFRVYRYTPAGELAFFGRPGSTPGRFGVVGAVASDSRGHVLVADKARCVVMVFDKAFNFLTEFGYRGPRPENLIIPDDVAVDGRDRVYVSQGGRRGVSVFALTQH